MSRVFANPLTELIEYEEMNKDLERGLGPVQISGCLDSQKVHLMEETCPEKAWKLVVTYDDTRAKEIYDDFRCFRPDVWLYPAKDLLFYNADIHGNLITRERLSVIRHLMEDDAGVVVTTIDGLMDHLAPLETMYDQVLHVENGDELDLEKWAKQLVSMGYERLGQVDGMGQFSIRGGILDIFPLTEELPIRIELWDTEVDSIRTFDPESQRSVEQLEQVEIYPAAEPESQGSVSFLNYFDGESGMIFLDEPSRLKERGEAVELEFRESMTNRLEHGYAEAAEIPQLFSTEEILKSSERPDTLCITGLEQRLPGMDIKKRYNIRVKNVNSYQNGFELLIKDLKRWKKEKYRVILLSASRTRASRLAGDLREYELSAFCPDQEFRQNLNQELRPNLNQELRPNPDQELRPNPDQDQRPNQELRPDQEQRPVQPGEILVTYGNLHRGFEYPQIKFVVITEGDMFGSERKKRRRKKAKHDGQQISSFEELSVGDYVVHEDHGLGIYRGIEKIEQDKIVKDYIKIEYADGGNLYLPATKLEGIQKYGSSDASHVPKLNRLGGEQWSKTKSRVKKAVQEIAKDLVKLYASRQDTPGFQYGPDTVWQNEFEELFPYDETDDQAQAIEDTKHDMESTRIMDRLICGDVGYGKTEIALRAAFKAIQENKQVVYLVPTTILAQQHYNTFLQRMKDFPVRVDLMSRFCTPSQVKKTKEDLQKGLVDIVIGTHKVLSKDIKFKDLGLLIIDEEQRFGVTHKEKIKQMKQNVDVLTLTATPIPRTLHMSLVGIRDMSVLEEPPVDRTPIQTYVMEYNDEMVREGISRELARGGQVYYVYNRVKNIEDVANHIQTLVPDATVVYAHGQMKERELEQIMLDFINGDIDVLVSTTIIETGLDIPNANTIIIHDADHMGLSQLYQLRGRVGRSSRTSYAFLMYRKDKVLKEDAEKRLQAIREFTELGSGIRIAMRDLEIRGAGNVLGAEQHGHMEAVGYDLYCKLLNQAVRALKGEHQEQEEFHTEVDCTMDAYIPSSYIKNEYQKLDVYKRISGIENEEEYLDMQDELIDRFGDIPKAVENLLTVAIIKAAAHKAYVTEVKINNQEIRLIMYKQAKLNTAGIPALIEEYKGDLKFLSAECPYFHYVDRRKHSDCMDMVAQTKEILQKLGSLAE